mgnify:CR=1 FL=1
MNNNLEAFEAVNTHGISIKNLKNKRVDICSFANVVGVVLKIIDDS